MRYINPFLVLYKNRDLLIQFTKREIDLRHKGSRLGHFWALITPTMMLGLYLFVFGVIFGGRFGVLPNENFFDYALALFLGISIFQVIGDTVNISPTLIVNQPNYVKKVVFPLEIISVSHVLSSFYFSLLSIGITLLLAPFSHGGLSIKAFLLPIILLPLTLLSLGISWALSAIGVFVRDLSHTTAFIATAIMYASAILYSLSRIPQSIAHILLLNPLVSIVDQSRCVLLWNRSISLQSIAYTYIISTSIFILGYIIFKRLRPYFAEVL